MKQMSLKKQAMITAGSSALMRALGFGIRLWISRMLGAEALGIMELASGAHMLALTPAAAGLPSAVSRLTAKAKSEEQKQLTLYAGRRAAIWMGCLITPLFFFLSPLIAEALGDGRTLPALLFFAPCVLTVGVSSVYDGYFFGQGKALPPALSEGAEQMARIGVLAAFVFLIPRVTVAYRAALPALASSVGEAVGLIVILLLAGSIPSYRKHPDERRMRKQLARLSAPLLLNRLCHTALRSLCGIVIPLRLMAAGYGRPEALSQFGMFNGMVMPLMFLPGMVSGALSTVGGPAVARCGTKKAEKQLILRLLLSALGTGISSAAALYFLSPLISRYFYRLPELSRLIRFACPLAVLLPLQQVSGGMLTGLGLQKHSLWASLLGSVALLLCTWQWVLRMGISGAAFASIAGHGLTLFCEMVYLLSRTRNKDL
ncbi:MAG: oligosaccharide flippase family protein [Clostridia bacterium]|nr:oligosaccharide flippase family protein [Clostridia bacterium]